MKRPTVLCAGLVTVDFLYELPSYPKAGEKHRAEAATTRTGGGALNAAAAIAALGGKAMLAGSIGDDMLGTVVREEVARLGIDGSCLEVRPGVPTARSAVVLTADGERTVVNHRDPRLFETPLSSIPEFDAILMDTRWPAAAKPLLQTACAGQKPSVIDAEAPLADVEDLLPLASHVAFSEQGLEDFTSSSDADGLTQAVQRLNTWVCVTRGPQPVLYHDGQKTEQVAAFPVTTSDTLGAGDVWHGAFALALADGIPPVESITFANAATALKLKRGDHPPRAEEVRTFIAQRS
ncbi:MAG: PfkB family carbohydrate kinase [Pseudomonadota bacterium]